MKPIISVKSQLSVWLDRRYLGNGKLIAELMSRMKRIGERVNDPINAVIH